MSVLYSPWGNSQFFDANGDPANGWKIYTYVAGSSTPLSTYTDSTGTVAQSNPIVINSLGFPTTGQIWLTSGLSYKLVLTDASDVVKKTQDNLSGVISSSSSTQSQWVASGLTPTYVSATSFTLAGDQTSAFHVGRRLQTTNTSGTIYSRIVTSAYGALTTITVVNDSGVLDSGLSAVNYGLLTAVGTSTPGAASPVLPRIDVASVAGTVDLTGNAITDDIRITGTNTITAFTIATGRRLLVTAGGAFTLTNNASIVTQTGANITCSNGDTFWIRATAANVVEILNYASATSTQQIQNISAVASSNTMIVGLSPTTLAFRNTSLTNGTPNVRTLGTLTNLTIPQGATLGAPSGNLTRISVGAIDNNGTIEPVVGGANINFDGSTLVNITAISNASNSSNVLYGTTSRSLVPLRYMGFLDSNQSSAGVYAAQPLLVQGAGGSAPQVGQWQYKRYPVVSTASGTSIDPFGGETINSQAKRITLNFVGASQASADYFIIRLGTAGGLLTTGYFSSATTNGSTIAITYGLMLETRLDTTANYTGRVLLELQDPVTNTWVFSATTHNQGGDSWTSSGSIVLSGILTQLRLTTNTAVTLDNGSISGMVEY
jgi:hypothetical protein